MSRDRCSQRVQAADSIRELLCRALRESSLRYLARTVAMMLFFLTQYAGAGGPRYIAGISYFNQGTVGTPLTWSQGTVNYYTDQGSLSPAVSGPQGDALVADAFSQWTSIPTAALSVTHAGQLAEDVSGANVYRNSDGTLTMPADIMPTATGTPVGIVYDVDGTVTDAFLGLGAGDASQCFGNAVFGGLDNFAATANFLHALVVINGNCVAQLPDPDVEYRLVRMLGQVLGLGWSQTNLNVQTDVPRPTADDYAGFSIMHATTTVLASRSISTARTIRRSKGFMIWRDYRFQMAGTVHNIKSVSSPSTRSGQIQ